MKTGKDWSHSSHENDVTGGDQLQMCIALSKNHLSGPNVHEIWPVQKVQSKNAVSSSDWQV